MTLIVVVEYSLPYCPNICPFFLATYAGRLNAPYEYACSENDSSTLAMHTG